jgi:hypothetical protein
VFTNGRKFSVAVLAGAMLLTLSLAISAGAQAGMIDAGTINVRTTEDIKATDTDSKVYRGVVDQDVRDRNGTFVVPKSSDAELVVKRISDNEIALDLNAITVNGQGYSGEFTAGDVSYGSGSIHIGSDNNITWQAPSNARVFVRVDNNPEQLFAEAPSGSQMASWIEPGHVYVFILRDMNGNELARDRLDLRSGTSYRG